jgi:hypothetical protein
MSVVPLSNIIKDKNTITVVGSDHEAEGVVKTSTTVDHTINNNNGVVSLMIHEDRDQPGSGTTPLNFVADEAKIITTAAVAPETKKKNDECTPREFFCSTVPTLLMSYVAFGGLQLTVCFEYLNPRTIIATDLCME